MAASTHFPISIVATCFVRIPLGSCDAEQLPPLVSRSFAATASLSPFDQSKISNAITKAFIAVEGATATGSRRIHDAVEI